MLGVGDYGDLFAIPDIYSQFGQLVLLGHWLCLKIIGMTFLKNENDKKNLSDHSNHNEPLLFCLLLQLFPTLIAEVALNVNICGFAFSARYHL